MFGLEVIEIVNIIVPIVNIIVPIITFGVSIAMLAILGLYTYFTWQANKERKEIFDLDTAPNVVGFIQLDTSVAYVNFIIKNIGKSLAKDVEIKVPGFEELVPNQHKDSAHESRRFLERGFKYLTPGQEVIISMFPLVYLNQEEKDDCCTLEIAWHGGYLDKNQRYKVPMGSELSFRHLTWKQNVKEK